MRITEIEAKSVLVASKLPGADYVVNPYTGCSFACAYCYASFMGRFVNEPIESWGDYLYVKRNAVEVFQRELRRLVKKNPKAVIFMGSVTDAWQGPEKKYRLARGVLEALVREDYPGEVSLLTKSPLIFRDADLIAALRDAEVGVTITATDDAIGRFMEVHAPAARDRIETLAQLNKAGLKTYAFVGPLFPHYRYRFDLLDDLFRAIRDTGTKSLFAEHLNTSAYIRRRIEPELAKAEPEVRRLYAEAALDTHKEAVSEMVLDLVAKYGLELRLGRVIDHVKTERA